MAKKTHDTNTSIEYDALAERPRDNGFIWHTAPKFEKIAFVASLVFVTSAIVFLVFEFTRETETWPYIGFNFSIALAFAFEAVFNWRHKRSLAIINIIAALAFLIIAFIRLFQ